MTKCSLVETTFLLLVTVSTVGCCHLYTTEEREHYTDTAGQPPLCRPQRRPHHPRGGRGCEQLDGGQSSVHDLRPLHDLVSGQL